MDNKSYLQVPGRDGRQSQIEERLGGGWKTDDGDNNNGIGNSSNNVGNSNDKYTAAIDLSNKCREFYKSRLEAANNMKSKWKYNNSTGASNINSITTQNHNSTDNSDTCSSPLSSSMSSSSLSSSSSSECVNDNEQKNVSRRQKTSIDAAMEKLRSEMVSLMDQDLSLMKQLLTLNETIEELKWQRQYYSCSTSCASLSASKNLDSNWSFSDTEMYDSEDDTVAAKHASHSSVQTGHVTGPTWHSTRTARKASRDFDKISLDSLAVRAESADSEPLADSTKTSSSSSFSSSSTATTIPVISTSLVESEDLEESNAQQQDSKLSSSYLSDHHVILNGPIIVRHDREQNSFDSGIHEAASGGELVWAV